MNKPLQPWDHGSASITAAEIVEGITYPPHAIRSLARAYLDLLQLLHDRRSVETRMTELPAPVELPESYRKDAAKLKKCQHGTLPAHDGRATCLPCVWISQGHIDAAYNICPHDRRLGNCRECGDS